MCEEKTKKCSKCGRVFPANNIYFIVRKGVKSGLQARCKECMGSSFKFPMQIKEGHKKCCHCQRELPADSEHFFKDKNSKDGFGSQCKECRGFDFSIRLKAIDTWKDGMKPCSKCGRVFPASRKFFYKNSEKSDGLYGKCKECMGGKMGHFHGKEAYNENGEKKCSTCGNWYPPTNEYFGNKKARADGLDCQCKKCVREYDEKNKERSKQRNRERYLRDKEHITEINMRWRKNNPEKVAAITKRSRSTEKFHKTAVRNQQKRDAKKSQLRATFTAEQWELCLEYFNHSCAYCGATSKKLTQDHVIPLSKDGEYTVNNIIPACLSCNSKKSNKDLLKWYVPELPFYSEIRKKKLLKYLKTDGEKQQMALEF